MPLLTVTQLKVVFIIMLLFLHSILGVVGCVYIAIIVSIKYFLIHNDDDYFKCRRPNPLSRLVSYSAVVTVCYS